MTATYRRRTPLAVANLLAAASLALLAANCAPAHPRVGTRTADGLVLATTDSTFVAEVINTNRPTVVYYWANGCLPCLFLGPRIGPLARRYRGRVTFWKLDWGWSAARYLRYNVQGVPTLVFYVGEREIDRLVGAPSGDLDATLAAWVDGAIAKAAARGAVTPALAAPEGARAAPVGAAPR